MSSSSMSPNEAYMIDAICWHCFVYYRHYALKQVIMGNNCLVTEMWDGRGWFEVATCEVGGIVCLKCTLHTHDCVHIDYYKCQVRLTPHTLEQKQRAWKINRERDEMEANLQESIKRNAKEAEESNQRFMHQYNDHLKEYENSSSGPPPIPDLEYD